MAHWGSEVLFRAIGSIFIQIAEGFAEKVELLRTKVPILELQLYRRLQ